MSENGQKKPVDSSLNNVPGKKIPWLQIISVIVSIMTLLVLSFRPTIWSWWEKDALEAVMICETWSVPNCVDHKIKNLGRTQSTDPNQTDIKDICKVKSMDHFLIYNDGATVIPELYITIPDSEYTEVVKQGEITEKFKRNTTYRPLGKLFSKDYILVRTWRRCCADSKGGVVIHRGVGIGKPPKIRYSISPVVDFNDTDFDFDDWVDKRIN